MVEAAITPRPRRHDAGSRRRGPPEVEGPSQVRTAVAMRLHGNIDETEVLGDAGHLQAAAVCRVFDYSDLITQNDLGARSHIRKVYRGDAACALGSQQVCIDASFGVRVREVKQDVDV